MKNILVSAALLALAAAPTSASASGASPRGGAGDDWGTTVTQGSNSRISQNDRLIRRGRAQVRRYITCDSCEYHGNLNRGNAAEVARAVRNGRFKIKEKNRDAVLFYLTERYGL